MKALILMRHGVILYNDKNNKITSFTKAMSEVENEKEFKVYFKNDDEGDNLSFLQNRVDTLRWDINYDKFKKEALLVRRK